VVRGLRAELGRIQEHDLVTGRLDQPLVTELVQRPRDDLANRSDRVRQLLLAHLHDQVARSGSGEVQQVADEALTHGQERVLGDVVEG